MSGLLDNRRDGGRLRRFRLRRLASRPDLHLAKKEDFLMHHEHFHFEKAAKKALSEKMSGSAIALLRMA